MTSVPSIECNHMWNKIKIDGKWYNVDVTADDPTPNMSTYTNHSSFLLSDEDIKTVSPSFIQFGTTHNGTEHLQ